MKNTIKKLLCLVLVTASICTFAGCTTDTSSDTQDSTEAQQTTTASVTNETDIKALHTYDAESDDPFAGPWQIVDGVGSDLTSFVYLFDGHEKATLVIGSTGYVEKYRVDTEKKTFIAQLLFGINGQYNYEFSDDNTKVTLTNIDNNTQTVMQKVASFDMIPMPDAQPKIDEKILGAWQSDNGTTVYFDKGGIMYENFFSFTYYKYSAENSVIKATYFELEETEVEYKYSIENDVLTLDDTKYTRISANDLT